MRLPVLILILLTGCGEPPTRSLGDARPGRDAAADAGVDAGVDAGEARPDAGEARPDAGGADADAGQSDACVFDDPAGPDCISCQGDGECCVFSINCPAGSICNVNDDQLYDPSRPDNICIRVVCAADGDCEGGKVCTLERMCRKPACQTDAECGPGERCLGGACETPQATVVSCEVTGHDTVIAEGGTWPLEAVARDAGGEVLPHVAFQWSSSEPDRVSASGAVATGGSEGGAALLTASAGNVACSGALRIINFLPPPSGSVRVVAVEHRRGVPIDAALVMIEGTPSFTGTTSADGSVIAPVGQISSVSISAPGYATVVVLSPGASQIVVPLPRYDPTRAGGVRGAVDISSSRRSDIQLGLVGQSFSQDILTLGRQPLLGADRIQSVIDAPELGFDQEEVELPGGFMMGLGTKRFTAGPERCFGAAPGSDELGCFVVRTDEGHRGLWTLSGQLKLSRITSIANELSQALAGEGAGPLAYLLTDVIRQLHHGVAASIETTGVPKVAVPGSGADCSNPQTPDYLSVCVPDFPSWPPVDLAASHDQSVFSTVDVPQLPAAGAGCSKGITLIGMTDLGSRGLVPLGFGSASDLADDFDPPDCVVAGRERPYGDTSPDLQDGQVALITAPRHDGLEEGDLLLVAIALDPYADSAARFQRSVRLERPSRFEESMSVAGPFLALPDGIVDPVNDRITGITAQGDFLRAELYGPAGAALVYAPVGATTIQLPASVGAILSSLSLSLLGTAETSVPYDALFDLHGSTRPDRSASFLEAFAIQEL